MPKRRLSKRRLDLRGELEAWRSTFDAGVTFDGDLEPVGIPTAIGRPTTEEVAQAWQRLGPVFLATYGRRNDLGHSHWAARQFGEPDA